MPRRKITSTRQKKAQTQLKRAVKRGDIPPDPTTKSKSDPRRGAGRNSRSSDQSSGSSAPVESARRLQSSFIKLPPAFLEQTRNLASTLPLSRPLSLGAAILPHCESPNPEALQNSPTNTPPLTCPKRPKWRYDMSKKEVEKNEEGLFQKWLTQTDEITTSWCSVTPPLRLDDARDGPAPAPEPSPSEAGMPHAPTSFERNLEVWRQLWRVTEISQILLILLDSRCPILHYPPSLHAYLSSTPYLAARTRTILVLTKTDISGAARADAWTAYLHGRYPGMRIVRVEAYAERDPMYAKGKNRANEAYLPSEFRQTLVNAVRVAHAELLEPPEHIKNHPDKLNRWKPSVKRDVNWQAVLAAHGSQVGFAVGGAAAPRTAQEQQTQDDSDSEGQEATEPEFLTIGLIGQPNVGKSSLLNALFGTHKVKASKTPGKTKHFQTLFWTSDVRLVDCPGLVMPNFVPMELQVLSGILPISRVSAIPLCIHYAAQLLPLERIYGLQHPTFAAGPAADRRTWRAGMRAPAPADSAEVPAAVWTAMDVLTAYALQKGWVTAQAGRPDVHRAGNAMLRALAEGRIRWAFWPPGTDLQTIGGAQADAEGTGVGILIPHAADGGWDDASDTGSDDGGIIPISGESDSDDDDLLLDEADGETVEDEEETSFELKDKTSGMMGRFGALMLDGIDEDEDDGKSSEGSRVLPED